MSTLWSLCGSIVEEVVIIIDDLIECTRMATSSHRVSGAILARFSSWKTCVACKQLETVRRVMLSVAPSL